MKMTNCPSCGEPAVERPTQQIGLRVAQTGPSRCKHCGWIEPIGEATQGFDLSQFVNHEICYIRNRDLNELGKLIAKVRTNSNFTT